MSDKVKITQKVADAIEYTWEIISRNKSNKYNKAQALTNWDYLVTEFNYGKLWGNELFYYANENPIAYMRALVEGYEIEEDQYIVNLWLLDGSYISKATIYDVDEGNTPVTKESKIIDTFTIYPWGNGVRQFGVRNKYIQTILTPDVLLKYTLVKIQS